MKLSPISNPNPNWSQQGDSRIQDKIISVKDLQKINKAAVK